MAVIKDRSYTGLFEIFAAAQILNRPVQPVFPPLGCDLYRVHCNRIVRAPGCSNNDKVLIMLSSLRSDSVPEHWVPNHFVHMVLRVQLVQAPRTGTFHRVTWNNKDYIGQVLETDELLDMGCISFMKRKPNTSLYYWPDQTDYSWDPFGSFIREVSLHLVEGESNQRCQLFGVD